MNISNYEVLINETNANCSLVVDLQQYNISFLKDNVLFYEVDSIKKEIKIQNETGQDLVTFLNIDAELQYYAFKTIELIILGGITEPTPAIIKSFSALLK
jgi:hypothetical protein